MRLDEILGRTAKILAAHAVGKARLGALRSVNGSHHARLMFVIGHVHGHSHGLGLLTVEPGAHRTGRRHQADHSLVAELLLNLLHRHLLHIDEGNADKWFDQGHKSVRSVARHNDAVTIVFFKALGTVVHGKRRVVTAFEQALRAIRNLRILFDHELEVFLISLGWRRLDDLVVEVDRRGRPQTADHTHFKGLGQRRDISREQRLRIIGGRQTLT